MTAPQSKFARCPKCFAVIKYNVGDTFVICIKCETKIKLAPQGK